MLTDFHPFIRNTATVGKHANGQQTDNEHTVTQQAAASACLKTKKASHDAFNGHVSLAKSYYTVSVF